MPAVRTREEQNPEASSSKTKSQSGPKRKHKHGKQKSVQEDPNAVPGVQKIKAALRQTKWLLAKDKLAADVRVEAERKLKALEGELEQAEIAKKERAYAVRYHKIKFFERRKITRKIKQTLKRLDSEESKSDKEKITAELHELRVDLNYILHYPKMKKYISLLPPEVRKGRGDETEAAPTSTAPAADAAKTNAEREEVRRWVREQMAEGNLPAEPEVETKSTSSLRGEKAPAQQWTTGKEKMGAAGKMGEQAEEEVGVEEDAFFGDDDSS
ncbi:unnamed protein product [Cyclocybe aegerita]|uniref:rRNA-processing protein EFG1 n=1 Tax=Cyclocybe aegerita TaxID=1973307 RepID=A0A8S0VXB9_CYCAE|nr:unnamed protein product [Cyclocybe aegerita]